MLMLTHRLPYPPDRGDRIRSYHMLKEIARHFEVAIACTSDEPVWLQHHQLLSTIAKRVAIQPISTWASKYKSIVAALSGQSLTPYYYYRQGLADTIVQWHEEAPFDVILTFCTGMIKYARLLAPQPGDHDSNGHSDKQAGNTGPSIRHVLDLVDVDSLKWRSYASKSWPPLSWLYRAEAKRLCSIEAGRFDHFDALAVVSEAEAQAYRKHIAEHPGLTVVGNGVDLDYFSTLPDSDSKTIVFVGVLNYKPNVDGVCWFVENVLGELKEHIPDARLLIIGRHPIPRVEQLAEQAGVEVVGSVPDVRVHMQEAAAVIAPLQIARGVQNKVLEAMACAKPVVCSPEAAQGIQAQDGQHLMIASEPSQWVEKLRKLLTDKPLRQQLGAEARRHVEINYSWSQRLAPLIKLLRGEPGGL